MMIEEMQIEPTELRERIFVAPIEVPLVTEEDSEELQNSEDSERRQQLCKELKFKKHLVQQVRKHNILYNKAHKQFSNVEAKDEAWQQIAKKLKSDVDSCKNIWCDLRYDYQRYARRLRKFFRNKNKENKRRPVMALEDDMIFLWRFINDKSTCPLPYMVVDTEVPKEQSDKNPQEDDDIVLVEDEPIVIDLDADEFKEKVEPKGRRGIITISKEIALLLQLIYVYPELYNTRNKFYSDYKRRGIIWNAIANELGDKATKLMKLWIHMQTRYEWEIIFSKSPEQSELAKAMDFIKPYLMRDTNSILKQAHYLKRSWQEPIEHFKNIFNLLAVMKKFPQIVNITDDNIGNVSKPDEFFRIWNEIGKIRATSAGQCETTWLILRSFYWELMNMRKHSYQLQDKWYFESIITELYALAKAAKPKVPEPQKTLETIDSLKKTAPTVSTPPAAAVANVDVQQLTDFVNVNFDEDKISTNRIEIKRNDNYANNTYTNSNNTNNTNNIINNNNNNINTSNTNDIDTSNINNIINNNTNNINSSNANNIQQQQLQLPKITSAKSLAPTNMPSTGMLKGLQIKPIGQLLSVRAMAATVTATATASTPVSANALLPVRPVAQVKTTPATFSLIPPALIPGSISTPTPMTDATTSGGNSSSVNLQFPFTLPKYTKVTAVSPSLSIRSTLPVETSNINIIPEFNEPMLPPLTSILPTTTAIPSFVPQVRNVSPSVQNNVSPPVQNVSLPAIQNVSLPAIQNVSSPAIQSVLSPIIMPLPKITAAVSLLNANEIMIELISSPNGNQLVVHGPPLSEKYLISMSKTATFIREVMAIPLLHNKSISKPTLVNTYWQYLSKKFDMPAHVCKACWNFLSENFNHFPQIAPMDELMRPFKSGIKVWKESDELFAKFDLNLVRGGWLKHKQELPHLMEEIGKYPCLYSDIAKFSKNALITTVPKHKEIQKAWRELRLKFADIAVYQAPISTSPAITTSFTHEAKLQEVWMLFRNVFLRYMWSLETGIDNKWPQNWWHILARMNYLMEYRYNRLEPFYFIVRNKIIEEIDRCNSIMMKTNAKNATATTSAKAADNVTETPFLQVKTWPKLQTRTDIDAHLLLLAIRRHPHIYQQSDAQEKVRAWHQVARELKSTVTACRLAFQQALKNNRIYHVRDPVSRCRLNQKYFKPFTDIYRAALKPTQLRKLNIKTPTELNQSLHSAASGSSAGVDSVDLTQAESNEVVFPERFIVDINMTSCEPALVMKNWCTALGSLPEQTQVNILPQLCELFAKYRSPPN